jgi:hypothetical protein
LELVMPHARLRRPVLLAATFLLTGALAFASPARAEEEPFRTTIRDILTKLMGQDLPADQLSALQNCSINAFTALTPEQKQGLVDAGVEDGDAYLDKLDKEEANPPAFQAAVHCFELLNAETLVGAPEAAEPTP